MIVLVGEGVTTSLYKSTTTSLYSALWRHPPPLSPYRFLRHRVATAHYSGLLRRYSGMYSSSIAMHTTRYIEPQLLYRFLSLYYIAHMCCMYAPTFLRTFSCHVIYFLKWQLFFKCVMVVLMLSCSNETLNNPWA
jgi:hypothetical protein